MASNEISNINVTISTALGHLQIYTDPVETKRAMKLIKDTPTLLYASYVDAAQRFGGKIIKRARECIDRDQPPRGASWPPLSEAYKERWHTDRHYYLSGQYYEAMGIFVDKLHFAGSGKFAGYQVHVGLPTTGKNHLHHATIKTKKERSGEGRGELTMLQLGNLLEFGFEAFGAHQVPARPLWIPLYAEAGGNRTIRIYLQNAIKRQLEHYLATGRPLIVSNAKSTAASNAAEKSTYITFNK